MSHLSASKVNTSPSTRLPLSTRAAPICKAPHRHSASRIHSQAGLAVGPLALLVFRPRLNPQRPPPRRSGPLLSPSWAGGSRAVSSRAGLSPTWSRSADFSRRPGVCPPGALSPPAASLALKPPLCRAAPPPEVGPPAPFLRRTRAPPAAVQRLPPPLPLAVPLFCPAGAFPAGPRPLCAPALLGRLPAAPLVQRPRFRTPR